MKAWVGASLVAALAVLLAIPAAAAARPGWEEKPRSLHLSFRAPASNGYAMSIETSGHRQVSMTLAKGGVSAAYRTTGRVSRNGIEADFGELGQLSVEFSGRPTRFVTRRGFLPGFIPQPRCRGRRGKQEAGTFHGTIRFEGENGFTRIDTDRARGTMRRTYRRLCKGGSGSGIFATLLGRAAGSAAGRSRLDELRLDVLIVAGNQAGRRVAFETFGVGGSSGEPLLDEFIRAIGPFAVARTIERTDGIRITRQGLAIGQEDSLIVSPPKRKRITATVAFPRPFEGTAEFEHRPGSPPTWVGSLLARLPGAGAVPLTGEELRTVFCRLPLAEDGTEGNACARQADEALAGDSDARLLLPQGSGSHSQALADVRLSWSR